MWEKRNEKIGHAFDCVYCVCVIITIALHIYQDWPDTDSCGIRTSHSNTQSENNGRILSPWVSVSALSRQIVHIISRIPGSCCCCCSYSILTSSSCCATCWRWVKSSWYCSLSLPPQAEAPLSLFPPKFSGVRLLSLPQHGFICKINCGSLAVIVAISNLNHEFRKYWWWCGSASSARCTGLIYQYLAESAYIVLPYNSAP